MELLLRQVGVVHCLKDKHIGIAMLPQALCICIAETLLETAVENLLRCIIMMGGSLVSRALRLPSVK